MTSDDAIPTEVDDEQTPGNSPTHAAAPRIAGKGTRAGTPADQAVTGDEAPPGDSSEDTDAGHAAVADGPGPDHADIAGLSYEAARDELVGIVSRLEAGRTDLEESMRLWERGEALAAHCSTWLDGAQERLERRMGATEDGAPDQGALQR